MPVTREAVADVLDRALALMNDEGKHWIQGAYRSSERLDDGQYGFCSVGAVCWSVNRSYIPTGHSQVEREALLALADVYGMHVFDSSHAVSKVAAWNDDPNTNWSKVVRRFKRAKALVEKKGLRSERLGK